MRRIYMLVICCLIVAACQPRNNVPDFELVTVIDNLVIDERSVPIFPRKAALTTDTARRFALDLPKRCTVDWDNQRVKSNLPEEVIEMINLGTGDELPGFAVENF
ncbi:MAG: hypothetical protein FWF34_01470, partial [Alphaproteobacteria bacterium]|nr:hypothetical protein [Alphaproteobacteria bacterium]